MRFKIGYAFAFAFSVALGYSSSVKAQEDDGLDVFLKDAGVETPTAEAPAASAAEAVEEKVEAAADAVAEKVEEAADAVAEKVEEAADAVAEKVEEAADAVAPVADAAETPAADAAETPAADAAETPAAEPAADAADADDAAETPAEEKVEEAAVAAEKPAAEAVVEAPADDAEALLAEITAAEMLRRETLDAQAAKEVEMADQAYARREYEDAFRYYELASKHLNDSPATAEMRAKCRTRMGECKYQLGRRAESEGDMEAAKKYYEDSLKLHHQLAKSALDRLASSSAERANEKDNADIVHRINDKDYKQTRDVYRRRLRRSRQYFATAEYDKALEECELVLRTQPQNTEAIRLRSLIAERMNRIERKEFMVTREEMMHQVSASWRPVYAPDSAQLEPVDGATTKVKPQDNSTLSIEQGIQKRMKAMKLPSVSFRPPSTLVDAVEYFRQASKDFDLPEIPAEERGINFVLRTPTALTGGAEASADSGDAFGSSAEEEDDAAASATGPIPQIPAITASNISLWEALSQVCQVTGYKFQVSGSFVIVMPKDATIDDFITRSYNVLDLFVDRVQSATTDIRESKKGAFGGGNTLDASDGGSQERDWKAFFEEMGVAWPPNSSITYIKTIGKLRVTNTADNLAVFEQALNELNVTPTLVEIETRFVEVAQEDLNSLGFEWLLNSDYTLNLGNKLGKALGIKPGEFGTGKYGESATAQYEYVNRGGISTKQLVQSPEQTSGGTVWGSKGLYTRTPIYGDASDATKITGYNVTRNKRNLGLNAFGGTSDYQNGNRYMSTVGNHISGAGESTNDQFMRINGFLGNADLSLILHMLSQRSDTDLLSAPKVVTRSGQQAIIKVVTEYIYPQDYDVTIESSSSGNGGGGWGGSSGGGQILAMVEPQNFTMREVGVILDVTPEVTAEGSMINLDLKPQVVDEPVWHDYGMKVPNTAGSNNSLLSGMDLTINNLSDDLLEKLLGGSEEQEYYTVPMEQPFFHVRSIETHLSIYNGATVVMGGLITEERKAMDDKVPFLGDIPFLGRLFRSRSEWSNKRNLLIFVTARLVDPRGRKVNIGNSDDVSSKQSAAPLTPAPEDK